MEPFSFPRRLYVAASILAGYALIAFVLKGTPLALIVAGLSLLILGVPLLLIGIPLDTLGLPVAVGQGILIALLLGVAWLACTRPQRSPLGIVATVLLTAVGLIAISGLTMPAGIGR